MALSRGFKEAFDWPLFVMVSTIAVLGVVNLYSATSAMPIQLRDIYIQQIYWLSLGAAVAVLIATIDYRYYERYAWFAYGLGIILLVLVFLLGREVRGSQRWIPIGSFSLQPSELMKVFFIVALAKHLHDDPRTEGRTLKDLIIRVCIHLRRGTDVRQEAPGNVEDPEQLVVPSPLVDVEEQRARRIRDVGDVHPAAGELPHQP